MSYVIIPLRQHPELRDGAAAWFHQKWGIPEETYRESMDRCLTGARVPQWYLALDGDRIVGGCGVIENDFHPRRDLTPNLCALYVEEDHRGRGIAGDMLRRVCVDMAEAGIRTLYLLTDHEGFYERYGWEYLCPVQGDGEETPSRMYRHRQPLVLYGTQPTALQQQRVIKRDRPTRWLMGSMWALGVMLGLGALGIGQYGDGAALPPLTAALLTALGLGIFSALRVSSRRSRGDRQKMLCRQAALQGGTLTRIYPDRVEQRSSRWGEGLPLDGSLRLTEYPDLLVLERGAGQILLRGEDLTDSQAEEAAALIREALPPENRFLVGRFRGSRRAPMAPLSLAESPLCFEQVPAGYQPTAPDVPGTAAAAGAACLLCAGLLTALYSLTPWVWLDLLIFLLGTGGAAACFLWLFSLLLKRPGRETALLSFTGAGLGISRGGGHRFLDPGGIRAIRTGDGALILTPEGDYRLRWTDAKNRQQLEWLLFG